MSNAQTNTYYCTQMHQLLETSKFDKVSKSIKQEMRHIGTSFINPKYSKHFRKMSIQQIEAATMYYVETFDYDRNHKNFEEDINRRFCKIEDAFIVDYNNKLLPGEVVDNAEETIKFRRYLIENPKYNVELNSGMLNWLLDCIAAEY